MKRGRPVRSPIRQNIVEILYFLGRGYGYDIYKIYKAVFPQVTMRSIYYHLKKGVAIGEFKIDKIEKERGNFSWGSEVEKIYYALGTKAMPVGNDKVRDYVNKISSKKKSVKK
jgi:hypothetical protein